MRLVQLMHPQYGRRVASVAGRSLLLTSSESVYQIALEAIEREATVSALTRDLSIEDTLDYDAIWDGVSDWEVLPSFDHPDEPSRCLVSGTGLTHRRSVDARQAMHTQTGSVTDSMRMYDWGVEGGRPDGDSIGVAPEWFYKGTGSIVRAHNESLIVPAFAGDGGEEAELAAVYIIGEDGQPYRLGMTQGNEFSDHVTEKKNYLYLAPSKLRNCSIGPELVLEPDFGSVSGVVRILRGASAVWSQPLLSGEANMCHSLANIEHHHFKFPEHRRPGDVHIHFLGADALSCASGISLCEGDVVDIEFAGYGRPLRNDIQMEQGPAQPVRVGAL